MAITNLTNTKWVFKKYAYDLNIPENTDYLINFISEGNNYTLLGLYHSEDIFYNSYHAWNETNWNDDNDRIIEITGGTDVTNASLISWLEANATQVNITDLTGTKWVINNSLSNMDSYQLYVNFVSNNTNYSGLQITDIGADNGVYYGNTRVYEGNTNIGETGWTNQTYRLISITGGNDVSNPDLLVWLNNNATLVPVVDLSNTK